MGQAAVAVILVVMVVVLSVRMIMRVILRAFVFKETPGIHRGLGAVRVIVAVAPLVAQRQQNHGPDPHAQGEEAVAPRAQRAGGWVDHGRTLSELARRKQWAHPPKAEAGGDAEGADIL